MSLLLPLIFLHLLFKWMSYVGIISQNFVISSAMSHIENYLLILIGLILFFPTKYNYELQK